MFFRFFVGQVELFAGAKVFEAHKPQVKPDFEAPKPRFVRRELGFEDAEVVRPAKVTAADVANQFLGVGDDEGFYGVRFFLPL